MGDIVGIVMEASANVFGVTVEDLCSGTRRREVVLARRCAAFTCHREGIPARVLAERIGVARWSVNRMVGDAVRDPSSMFITSCRMVQYRISTLKARN